MSATERWQTLVVMKKFFSFIFVILVLIILLLWVFKAQLVSYVISKESGVDVRIESVSLSLNGFRAKNIVAHDPKSATTLSFGLVDVKTDLLKIFRDVVTINNLKLDDVTIKSDPGKIDLSQFGGLFQRKNSSPKKSSRSGQRYVIEATEASNVQIQVENPFQIASS